MTQWFPPEHAAFGVMMSELADYLAASGWTGSIVTARPSHPGGRVHPGYRRGETPPPEHGPFPVRRIATVIIAGRGGAARAAGFLSFSLHAALRVLLARRRPSMVLAPLQPLFLGPALGWACRLRGVPLVFIVQDLHPDAMIDLGLVRRGWAVGLLRWMERTGYRSAAGIITICEEFRRKIAGRAGAGGPPCVTISNWAGHGLEAGRRGAMRPALGVGPDEPLALFAGTLALSSGAHVLLDAAKILASRGSPVQMALVGEGPLETELRRRIEAESLANVRMHPFVPRDRLADLLADADVALVTLDPKTAANSLPSKAISYLALGRPIVATCPPECPLASQLRASGAAELVAPDDPAALADAIERLVAAPGRRASMGEAGRGFVQRELSPVRCLEAYREFLTSVLARSTSRAGHG